MNRIFSSRPVRKPGRRGGRPPANVAVYEEVSADPIIAGFGAYGASGQPLPNIPAMDSVWGDYGNAQRDIMLGQGDPATLVTDAAGRIREAIAGS